MTQVQLSPDGARYVTLGAGRRVPRPFNGRVLIPWVCGASPARWWWMSRIAAVWYVAAVTVLASHWLDWSAAAAAAILAAAIPGTIHFNTTRFPVLVDLPAMALAATSAAFTVHGHPIIGAAVACLAATTKETAPIFAALWAWHPLPLAALAISAALQLRRTGPEPVETEHLDHTTRHPIRASMAAHRGQWRNPTLWILPWGPLTAALLFPSAHLAATLAIAHAQTLIATDTHRLTAWAAPTAAVTLTAHTPNQYLLALALAAILYPSNTV